MRKALLIFVLILSAPLGAQTYPTKPVRLIVPYAPGGSVDLVARVLRQGLQDAFGQPVVVENRAGAGGAIGLEAAVKSLPDGHTLVMSGSGAIIVSAHLTKLPYDPMKDLAPVSLLTTLPMLIASHPSLPVRNVAELIAYAKAKPGALNYSSNGLNSGAFLAAELFKNMTAIQMTHVPYKGAAPGSAAIAAGEVQLGFVDGAAVMPFVRTGQVRALAVTDQKRSTIVGDVPTVAESGVPKYSVTAWVGMLAPSGTPSSTISRINAETVRLLKIPEVRDQIFKVHMEPAPQSVEAFARLISEGWTQSRIIIQQAGIKAE